MVGSCGHDDELMAAELPALCDKAPRLGYVLGSEGSCTSHERHGVARRTASARQIRENERGY